MTLVPSRRGSSNSGRTSCARLWRSLKSGRARRSSIRTKRPGSSSRARS